MTRDVPTVAETAQPLPSPQLLTQTESDHALTLRETELQVYCYRPTGTVHWTDSELEPGLPSACLPVDPQCAHRLPN
jgi:hypothetical protein